MGDNTEIPEGARVTGDLECVVLSSPPSFFSQVARLAVAEKGCRYKYFTVDHTKNEHLVPWYVKLNPNAWVPTLLVKGNQPVCESMDIVLYVDQNFKGERQLDKEIKASPQVKRRYDEFMKMYGAVMVEQFSFGTLMSTPLGQVFPSIWLLMLNPIYQQINSSKNGPEIVRLFEKKLVMRAEQAHAWILNHKASFEEATERGVKLLSQVEAWMLENNSEWAVGTKEYSIADVFLTVYLHRVAMNKAFVEREVNSRPHLARYFDKVLKRPTSKIANCNTINLPPNMVIRFGLGIGLTVLNVLFGLALWFIGVKVTRDNALKWFGGFTFGFAGVVWALTSYGRGRLAAFCDRMLDTKKNEYSPPTLPSSNR